MKTEIIPQTDIQDGETGMAEMALVMKEEYMAWQTKMSKFDSLHSRAKSLEDYTNLPSAVVSILDDLKNG